MLIVIYKYRGDDLQQTTRRTKTKMESDLSVLIIFTFEEQSCLVLDSMCRFHILGAANFFILNGMNIAGLN